MKPHSYRHYDYRSGRFISEDPIGFRGQDSNLYRYVSNQPTQLIDPSGKLGFPAAGAIAGGIVGGFSGAYNSGSCSIFGVIGDAFIGAGVGAVGGFFVGVGAQFGQTRLIKFQKEMNLLLN